MITKPFGCAVVEGGMPDGGCWVTNPVALCWKREGLLGVRLFALSRAKRSSLL